ncbi:MAG: TolC family protein [Pseudomonadales bacterium]|nr:TolC family protein [Pseudomonadales bacterium]
MTNDLVPLGKVELPARHAVALYILFFILFIKATDLYAGQDPNVVAAEPDQFSYWALKSLKHNPEINAAYYEWQSTVSSSNGADSLPDPTVSFEYFIDEVQTRTGPQEYRIMLAQKFPWFGKRQLASEMARLRAKAALAKLEHLRIATLQRLASFWISGIHLARQLEISREELNLLTQIERLALTRYRLAKASHPDLIQLQVKRGQLENHLTALKRKQQVVSSEIATISNFVIAEKVHWRSSYSLPHMNQTTFSSADFDWLYQQAKENNPQLILGQRKVDLSNKQAAQIRLKSRPDITLKYGRIFTSSAHSGIDNNGEDPQYVGVGINIPLWENKNSSALSAAKNRVHATQFDLQLLGNRIRNELKLNLLHSDDLIQQLTRYHDHLVPQAELALTTVLKSYQTGNSSFSDLIDTEQLLLNLKREQNNLTKDLWLAANNIAALTNNYHKNFIQGL